MQFCYKKMIISFFVHTIVTLRRTIQHACVIQNKEKKKRRGCVWRHCPFTFPAWISLVQDILSLTLFVCFSCCRVYVSKTTWCLRSHNTTTASASTTSSHCFVQLPFSAFQAFPNSGPIRIPVWRAWQFMTARYEHRKNLAVFIKSSITSRPSKQSGCFS